VDFRKKSVIFIPSQIRFEETYKTYQNVQRTFLFGSYFRFHGIIFGKVIRSTLFPEKSDIPWLLQYSRLCNRTFLNIRKQTLPPKCIYDADMYIIRMAMFYKCNASKLAE